MQNTPLLGGGDHPDRVVMTQGLSTGSNVVENRILQCSITQLLSLPQGDAGFIEFLNTHIDDLMLFCDYVRDHLLKHLTERHVNDVLLMSYNNLVIDLMRFKNDTRLEHYDCNYWCQLSYHDFVDNVHAFEVYWEYTFEQIYAHDYPEYAAKFGVHVERDEYQGQSFRYCMYNSISPQMDEFISKYNMHKKHYRSGWQHDIIYYSSITRDDEVTELLAILAALLTFTNEESMREHIIPMSQYFDSLYHLALRRAHLVKALGHRRAVPLLNGDIQENYEAQSMSDYSTEIVAFVFPFAFTIFLISCCTRVEQFIDRQYQILCYIYAAFIEATWYQRLEYIFFKISEWFIGYSLTMLVLKFISLWWRYEEEEYEAQSMSDVLRNSDQVMDIVERANIVTNVIIEIYSIFQEYATLAVSKIVYKIYTKLSNIYIVCTGHTLCGRIRKGSACDDLVKLFLQKWLFDSESVAKTHSQMKGQALTDVLQNLNDKSKDAMALVESDFGQKLVTFCSLMICVPFVNKMGVKPESFYHDQFSIMLLRKKYAKAGIALPILLLETSTDIFLKLVEVCSVGPTALYVSREHHTGFEHDYQWLRRNHTNFSCCTEAMDEHGEPDPFTLDTYAARCERALALLDKIIPTLRKHPYALMRAEKQRGLIVDWQNDCYAESRANITRVQPIGIMFVGQPSIGKSALQDITLKVLHDTDNKTGRFGVVYHPNNVFHFLPSEDFYSGFSSAHTSIVLDDVAQKRPDIMVALGGDDIMDVIRIVNTQPFSPPQAELHKKGKTPMRCRYVVGTTNTESLNAQFVFNNPAAVYRRFIFVRCFVREEFVDSPGNGLRGDVSNPENVDLWVFVIIKHFPIENNTTKRFYNPVKSASLKKIVWDDTESRDTRCDMNQYVNFLRNQAAAHWAQQDKSRIIQKLLEDDDKCDCGVPLRLCNHTCWNAQSFSTIYRFLTGRWVVQNYIWVVLMMAFAPTWSLFGIAFSIYSTMSRVYTPTGFFPSFMQSIWTLTLMSSLSVLLTTHSLLEWISPTKLDNTIEAPRLPLRLAMQLLPMLPSNTTMEFVKEGLMETHNRPVLNEGMWSRLNKKWANGLNMVAPDYFSNWVENKIVDMDQSYTFFRKHVVQDWRFQSCVLFIVLVKIAIKFTKATESFSGQAQEAVPEADVYERSHKSAWPRENAIGEFPNAGRTVRQYDIVNQTILNTVLLKLFFDNEMITTNGFIVKGNVVVTVAHFAKNRIPKRAEVIRLWKNGETSTVDFGCDDTNVCVMRSRDLMFIQSNRIIPGRDMTDYLLKKNKPVAISAPGLLTYVDPISGDHTKVECKRVSDNNVIGRYSYDGEYFDATGQLRVAYNGITRIGFCGAPLIVNQGIENFIPGIHCAGTINKDTGLTNGVAARLYVEYVNEALERLNGFPMPNDADDDIAFNMNAEAMQIAKVHTKCVTNELSGEYHRIGASALPRARPRTQVGRTPVVKDVLEYYREHTAFTKILHTSPIHCSEREATKLAMTPAFKNSNFFPGEIAFVVNSMTTEFIRTISHERLNRMKPVTWSVAINGCDNIPYLDRINMGTSGGYGHSGPKKKMFVLTNPTSQHMVNYEMGEDLKKEVDYILNQYQQGKEANPVFKCSFKDEPITLEKAELNKVRIFTGSPIAFSLVARKYYMSFIRECVGRHRLDFEMAIGANAHGKDWGDIHHHVRIHGVDRCFAGDYKAFDKQMSPELIIAAFEVIINIFELAGWDEDDLQVARCIATDTAFPTTDLFGTLVQLYGANPSGHVLTTPINSLVNSMYIRMACVRIFHNRGFSFTTEFGDKMIDMTRFRKVISLVTYGDDNCGSISANYPFITHTTIQEALGEAGIVYTMDQKDAQSVGLVHIKDITFLKRRFVYDPQLDRFQAPLLEESIFKSLTVWTRSRSISVQEQMAAIICSANREYFFHGIEIFEHRHKLFVKLIQQYDLLDYIPNSRLDSFQEILESIKIGESPDYKIGVDVLQRLDRVHSTHK